MAMGYSENEAFSAIRISTGRFSDEKHILAFLTDLRQCMGK
jgi:cysteine sulfinate desulfinase/cysteine desulfurase-like protein